MNIFLDTDILLDFLGDRRPFSKFALALFKEAENNDLKLYTSANSITTTYYILTKLSTEKNARTLITELIDVLQIIPVDKGILKLAFSSEFKDVEDSVQHYSALASGNIDFIVTRNLRDYRLSLLPVAGPEEMVNRLGLKI